MTGARIPVVGLVWAGPHRRVPGLRRVRPAPGGAGGRRPDGRHLRRGLGAPASRASLAGVALAVAAWHFFAAVAFLVFVPPLAAFAFMAVFFGRTLRAGAQPLISRIARKEDPDAAAGSGAATRGGSPAPGPPASRHSSSSRWDWRRSCRSRRGRAGCRSSASWCPARSFSASTPTATIAFRTARRDRSPCWSPTWSRCSARSRWSPAATAVPGGSRR